MSRIFKIALVAQAALFAAIAIALLAVVLDSPGPPGAPPPKGAVPRSANPLSETLARCGTMGMDAIDDVDCQAAWDAQSRRFFAPRESGGR